MAGMNKRPKVRIYLSHPYGGKEENREKAAQIAQLYRTIWDAEGKKNWELLNPIEYFEPFTGLHENTILELAVNLMETCDGVLFAPGWRRSRGCRYEHWRAHRSKGRVHYFQAEIPEEVIKK